MPLAGSRVANTFVIRFTLPEAAITGGVSLVFGATSEIERKLFLSTLSAGTYNLELSSIANAANEKNQPLSFNDMWDVLGNVKKISIRGDNWLCSYRGDGSEAVTIQNVTLYKIERVYT